jgi:hypothetical protein
VAKRHRAGRKRAGIAGNVSAKHGAAAPIPKKFEQALHALRDYVNSWPMKNLALAYLTLPPPPQGILSAIANAADDLGPASGAFDDLDFVFGQAIEVVNQSVNLRVRGSNLALNRGPSLWRARTRRLLVQL